MLFDQYKPFLDLAVMNRPISPSTQMCLFLLQWPRLCEVSSREGRAFGVKKEVLIFLSTINPMLQDRNVDCKRKGRRGEWSKFIMQSGRYFCLLSSLIPYWQVTLHLPIKEWYHNTTNNNLQYWGIDYPPLTAYMSWLCGYIGDRINPEWMALLSSHGFD